MDGGDGTAAPDKEQRIHDRAYELWEREGKPDGRDVEFWQKAVTEIAAEDAGDPATDGAETA